jgi:hypothetical protein
MRSRGRRHRRALAPKRDPGDNPSVAQPTLESQSTPAADVRWLPAPTPTIHPATDLGGVTVLKHGNLYLLTDAFGDIHPDGRGLGLYDLDTRVLSCAVLRLNGARPTLLRSQVSANHEGVIQLTNPEFRRNRDDKVGAVPVARQSLSMLRRRWIGDGLAEQITVTNFSAGEQSIVLDLELDVDGADIFEVRGQARAGRGRFLDTAATDRSLVFSPGPRVRRCTCLPPPVGRCDLNDDLASASGEGSRSESAGRPGPGRREHRVEWRL